MKSEMNFILHPTLGKVHFKRSKRAKYIRLSINSSKKINVTIPYNNSRLNAEKFINLKTDWIKKQLIKIDQRNLYTLSNKENDNNYNEQEAKAILRCRLDELARMYGFSYNRSCIRSQKTRWGSCSAKNNINLNIKLLKLPKDLRDYVILHELVHTKIKDHSKIFWNEMAKYYPNPQAIDKKLRNFNLKIL